MRPPDAASGLDPAALALAATRLQALLPPLPTPCWPAVWTGRAATAARLAAVPPLDAYGQIRLAAAEAADTLALTAAALADAEQLRRTADRLALVEPPADPRSLPGAADPNALAAVGRLRADADAQVAQADAQCAARLRALVEGTVPLLPPPRPLPSPEQVAQGDLARQGWASVAPALVGPLAALTAVATAADPDAPPAAREIATRIALAHRPGLLAPAADGRERQYLLAGTGGEVAEVWGDVSRARAVLVLVPGTTTSEGHFGGAQRQGDAAFEELWAQAGPDVAVVSWLGSPEPPDVLRAALQAYAKKAAPRLRDFVRGLPVPAGARVTVVGHSYGAVVAGLAVRDGLRPAALVGVAPAGFGPQVHDGADLDGVPTYVLSAAHDPIKDEFAVQGLLQALAPVPVDRLLGAAGIGHLGDDPVCLPGTVQLASGDDAAGGLPLSFDVRLHDSYFDPGSDTLRQIVAVAAGLPVVVAPPARCDGLPGHSAH